VPTTIIAESARVAVQPKSPRGDPRVSRASVHERRRVGKQQACRQRLAFEGLDNGWCADPDRLQRICDWLGLDDVQRFFDRW
jgi:hypothetical protein